MSDTIRHADGERCPGCPEATCCDLGSVLITGATRHNTAERAWVLVLFDGHKRAMKAVRVFYCPFCGEALPPDPVHRDVKPENWPDRELAGQGRLFDKP